MALKPTDWNAPNLQLRVYMYTYIVGGVGIIMFMQLFIIPSEFNGSLNHAVTNYAFECRIILTAPHARP